MLGNIQDILDIKRLERDILISKKFARLGQISLAVDYLHAKDSAQTRASHSVEVANTCEIMNMLISQKVGFNIDRLGVGRIVGLLHDIGHTAFGHEGEKILRRLSKEYSNGLVEFEGNANNYITIQKNGLLSTASKEVRHHVLASLAKHEEELYNEQDSIRDILKKEARKDKEYMNSKGLTVKYIDKTIQCQVMDIADENCYIISDIVDSINVLTDEQLAEIFSKELPKEVAHELIIALFESKNSFRKKMQKYHELFCSNFTLNKKGVIVAEDSRVESIRKSMARINLVYILNAPSVKELREKAAIKIETVFRFYFENEITDLIPSNFYKKEFKKTSGVERIKVVRNMLGSITNKGLVKELKKIQSL